MLTVAKCQFCGVDTTIDTMVDGGEFAGMFERLAVRSATCNRCGDEHAEQLRAESERRRADERERERLALEQAFVGIVGRKYRDCSLETFVASSPAQAAALRAAKEFSTEPRGFLYLHGKPGVGKTHLAVGIFRDHARRLSGSAPDQRFLDVDFWTVPELLLHLRSQIGGDTSEFDAVEPLMRSKLLVLDDLGAEKITDWVRQAFYVVISRRERDELPTVITSNLSLGEIEARVGDERITSRIGGAARIVRVDGADGRIEGRKR